MYVYMYVYIIYIYIYSLRIPTLVYNCQPRPRSFLDSSRPAPGASLGVNLTCLLLLTRL